MKINRTELFNMNDVVEGSDRGDFEGQILVLAEGKVMDFMREFQKPEFQLWKATGGFGCKPFTSGTAVFAECLGDGEEARFSRGDFLGVLKPEIANELFDSEIGKESCIDE